MKCKNCQTEYQDTLTACPVCSEQNASFQGEGAYEGKITARYPSAVELIKEAGKSKLLLVATILYTISCAISFISGDGLPVLEILVTLGLWLFYSDCQKPTVDPYVMNTTPLTLIKTSQNIEYVLCWIGAVASAVSIAALFFIPSEIKDSVLDFSGFIGIITVVLIVATVTLVAEIIIKKGIINYLKSIIESAKTGLRPQKLPKYTPYLWIAHSGLSIILCFTALFALNFLLDILSRIVNPTLSTSFGYFGIQSNMSFTQATELMRSPLVILPGIITNLIPIVANILFAKVLLDAKKHFESAYYPAPEELFYQKQEYYNARAAAAAEYAANAWQYQGYPQNQYGQPYQLYEQAYSQPNAQPPQNKQVQSPTDSENKEETPMN